MTEPKVLAVIPARGGSKRLPRKNIKTINGIPLIAYTIEAAKNAKLLTDFLVTTEDAEILKVAKEYGAPTPFIRPESLSGDEIRNIETVNHALMFMEEKRGFQYDIVVLLQPTSPIRSSDHIDQAVRMLWNSKLPSLASVKGPYQKRDPILKRINSDGELVSYSSDPALDQREPFYIYNAALYAVKRDYFVRENKLISDIQVPLVMDKYHSTDVDDLADSLVAETYLQYLNNLKETI